jgi:hypothetical protein
MACGRSACCTLWQTDPDEPTPELKFIGSLRLSVHEARARAYTRMRRSLTDVRRATVQLDGTYDHVVALEDEVQLREFAVTSRMRKKGRVKVRSQSCSAPVQATFSARRCRSAMQSAVSLRSGALCYSCTVRARDHCGR